MIGTLKILSGAIHWPRIDRELSIIPYTNLKALRFLILLKPMFHGDTHEPQRSHLHFEGIWTWSTLSDADLYVISVHHTVVISGRIWGLPAWLIEDLRIRSSNPAFLRGGETAGDEERLLPLWPSTNWMWANILMQVENEPQLLLAKKSSGDQRDLMIEKAGHYLA